MNVFAGFDREISRIVVLMSVLIRRPQLHLPNSKGKLAIEKRRHRPLDESIDESRIGKEHREQPRVDDDMRDESMRMEVSDELRERDENRQMP